MKSRTKLGHQIIFFLFSGVLNFLINITAYCSLTYLGFHYLLSSGIGWSFGVVNSYFVNKHFTFKSKSPMGKEFSRHLCVYVLQLLLSWSGLIILIDIYGFGYYVSYAINIVFVTVVSFFGLKYFAFRTHAFQNID
ncbi:GtrA family protein [Geopsychrobacter electrodiphilus]|uniref:GtrA family protein n=1 Tax=Geopsychrobacter electrodiphilus TaxID=225196 RepID=UPI00036F4E6B